MGFLAERAYEGKDDDEAPGPLQKIRASICEIAELYAQKYLDAFPQLGSFVNGVWNMLTTVGPGTREDVVSHRRRTKRARSPMTARIEGITVSLGGCEDGEPSGNVCRARHPAGVLRKDHLAKHELTT